MAAADTQSPDHETDSLEGPEFWQTYSPHFEFPISLIGSIFLVAVLFAGIAAVIYYSMVRGEDRTPVPMMGVDGGFDDSGDGKQGGGGQDNPLAIGDLTPTAKDYEKLPEFSPIADVKVDIQKKIQIEDPSGTIPISDAKAREYAALDDALRGKMIGSQKGMGGGDGQGPDQKGSGNSGSGASSSRARSLRWTLSFRTTDGRDYLDQLAAIGATILVPIPPENKQAVIFRDLRNPRSEPMTEKDWNNIQYQVRFCDAKQDSVRSVALALNLPFTPNSFWAVFPKGLEEELAAKETGYANRRPEDIEETKFVVTVRGGKATIVVHSQSLIRK